MEDARFWLLVTALILVAVAILAVIYFKKEGANALSQVLENKGNFAGTLCLEFGHISHEIKSTEAGNVQGVTLSVG